MKRLTRLATPALALAAAIGAPLTVQAAPEFYGRVNVSLDRLSDYPDGSLSGQLNDVQAARSPLEEGWFLESNSSRLGVRGSEPLDVADLSVIYQLEVGYDVDGDSDTFSTRNSFVGLGTRFGEVFAGRYDSPVKIAEGDVDQFNNTAADIGGYFFGQRRNSNTLNWKSPDFSGLVVRAQLAPGEGDTSGDEEKDGLADTFGLSATWSGETLFAALAYERSYQEVDNPAPPPALVDADRDLLRGTLGVTLGELALGAMVEQLRLDPDVAGADRLDGTSYLLSAGWRLLPRVTLKAQAGRFDGDDLGYEDDILTAGADYKLGRQTKVYGLVSSSDATITYPGGVDADDSGSLFSVGMEHKF
jgi:predicted porin